MNGHSNSLFYKTALVVSCYQMLKNLTIRASTYRLNPYNFAEA